MVKGAELIDGWNVSVKMALDLTWCVDGTASRSKCDLVKMNCESKELWLMLLNGKDDVPQAVLRLSTVISKDDRASENKKMVALI